MTTIQRYGVFGGSFDPPHYGHLVLAETARIQLSLDQVLFVPAGQPPHKHDELLSPPEDRARLVLAAIADNPAFCLSRVDLDRPGPHYTADMLALLRVRYPSVNAWYFLMGEDSLHDLLSWHDPGEILQQAQLAVMHRMGKSADITELSEAIPLLSERLIWLDAPRVDFSATELRSRVARGLSLRYLVPPGVVDYIQAHRLYRSLASGTP